MSRVDRVHDLENFIKSHPGGKLIDHKGLDLDDATLAMAIPGGFAFLRVVGEEEEIPRCWYRLQKKIAHLRDQVLTEHREPDLYLVLLTEGTLDRPNPDAQMIMRDPYVCRKLILEWGERPIDSVLAETPFWSLELPPAVSEPPTVKDTMGVLGYDPEAIDALLSIGADRLAEHLLPAPGVPVLTWSSAPEQNAIPTPGVRRPRERSRQRNDGQLPGQRWRIKEIILEGFRAYKEKQSIDLDANLVVIYAPNGTGKTSLCEGIEWAMTGQAHRIGKPGHDAPDDAEPPVRHVERSAAKVTLKLGMGDQTKVIERYDGEDKSYWNVPDAGDSQRDLITSALDAQVPASRSVTWIREAFLRYHYLEQGTSFEFLSKSSPRERYEIFQLMMGGAEYALAREKLAAVAVALTRKQDKQKAEVTSARENLTFWTGEVDRLAGKVTSDITQVAGHDITAVALQAWQMSRELGLVSGDLQAPHGERALAELIDQQAQARLKAADEGLRILRSLPPKLEERSSILDTIRALEAGLQEHERERIDLDTRRSETKKFLQQVARQKEEVEQKVADNEEAQAKVRRLLELSPLIAQGRESVARITDEERNALEKLSAQRVELKPKQERLSALQEDRSQRGQALERLERRSDELRAARVALDAWLAADEERRNVEAQLGAIGARRENLTGLIVQADLEVAQAQQAQLEMEREADDLRRALSERQRLVAALQAHIDDRDCPLCGTLFDDRNDLVRAVEASLRAVPPALTALEQKLTAGKTALEEKTSRIQLWRDELTKLETSRTDLLVRQNSLVIQLDSNATLIHRYLGNVEIGPETRRMIATSIAGIQTQIKDAQIASGDVEREIAEAEVAVLQRVQAGGQLQTEADQYARQRIQAQQSLAELQAEESELLSTLSEGESAEEAAGRIKVELEAAHRELTRLNGELQSAQASLSTLDERLISLSALKEQHDRERTALRESLSDLNHQMQGVGLASDAGPEDVSVAMEKVQFTAERLRSLGGMVVLLRAAGALKESQSAHTEAQAHVADAARKLQEEQQRLNRIDNVLDECSRLEGHLKTESGRLVKSREGSFRPTIAHIYQRLNAHPYFDDVELVIDDQAEEFRVQVMHPRTRQPIGGVVQYYSMAQINIVTLSIFMAQALLQGWSRLSTIILDDPVQHLDDMNTYALLDLLQVVSKMGRQLIVTTSDRQIYKLMLIKFGALNSGEHSEFKAYRLQGIGEKGPVVIPDTDLISVD